MIGFFPTPYKDELVYSWLCRYMVWSGYTAATDAYRDLYANPIIRPSVELMNNMTKDTLTVMTKYMPMRELVYKHTLFPEYGRFIEPIRRDRLLKECDFTKGNWNNNLMRPAGLGDRYLRYCPVCVKEDRETYGETYWNRLHQITGMKVCVKHGVYLLDSSILLETKLTRMKAAEIVIDEPEGAVECHDEQILGLSLYMAEVFLSPNYSHDGIGRYLNNRIDPKYLRSNGERLMSELYNEYKAFYRSLSKEMLMSSNVMTRIYRGKPGLFGYICQLAYFEGVSPEELLHDGAETEDGDIFDRVSHKTGEPLERVKLIGEALLEEIKKDNGIRVRHVRQKVNLDKEDEQLSFKVREIAAEIYGSGEERPRKVTMSAVARVLHVDGHKMKRMKRCMEELERYQESQEHYWARELIWAVGELERRGEPLNFKHLRNLINLRRENIQDSLKDLKRLNTEISSIVISILGE